VPIFEYVCKDCSRRFEALVYGSKKAACPHCKSARIEQQLSVFAVAGSSKSGASDFGDLGSRESGGACGSCGDPRGEGACSLDDMD